MQSGTVCDILWFVISVYTSILDNIKTLASFLCKKVTMTQIATNTFNKHGHIYCIYKDNDIIYVMVNSVNFEIVVSWGTRTNNQSVFKSQLMLLIKFRDFLLVSTLLIFSSNFVGRVFSWQIFFSLLRKKEKERHFRVFISLKTSLLSYVIVLTTLQTSGHSDLCK